MCRANTEPARLMREVEGYARARPRCRKCMILQGLRVIAKCDGLC